MQMQFTPEEAIQYARGGKLEEWLHAFLTTVGRNEPLSRGLRLQQRYYLGPMPFPLSLLERCLGPEEGMEYRVPLAAWEESTGAMRAALREGWQPAPLLVEYRGGTLSVRDGNHRHGALVLSGVAEYLTIFWFNSEADRAEFAAAHAGRLGTWRGVMPTERAAALPVDLTGRVAVVTGASRRRGIGAAICRALAAQGADILFTHWRAYDRAQTDWLDEDGPAALEAELRGTGVRVTALEVDLSLPESPGRVLDAVEARLGPPTILVNNAAYSTRDGYEALDAATLDAHYSVNVRATALLSVLFARRFDQGSGGRIINLSSGQGVGPMPGELAYAATKGAIEAFTRTLAAEVARKGITVNAVDPGATDTGWMTDEIRAVILRESPSGRLGAPADAARLVAFLASDAGTWITGQIIHSRGGL